MTAINQQVRVGEGEQGTIVVVAAWCERCQQESVPDRDGCCMFCSTQIVDLDTLSAKELRAQLERDKPGRVIPLRGPTPALTPLQVPAEHVGKPVRLPGRRDLDDAEAPVLKIAEGFSLPIDVAGEATAILAKRGAGKTNTARVLAEEYLAVGVQLIVLDPIGVWWGMRSNADGSDGLPIPILGGEHGDVTLPVRGGAPVADAVIESGTSAILDLSDFSKDEARTFVADFAEQLYARKLRDPSLIHVILEEADEFAPQRARAGGDPEETSRMRGAVEQLARRGRSRGIGMTMVTQRSSALSKDVLTQADVLIAMRTTGPTDVKAIQEWVRHNADAGDEVVRSLSSLQTGEGWVWNPQRDLIARVHVRLARTFDSSSTPKFGEARAAPTRKATVTLPLQLLDVEEPDLDLDADYRLPDSDGRFGCKHPGCTGRSRHNAGPKAYLCPDHGGSSLEEPVVVIEEQPRPPRPPRAAPAPPAPAPALEVDGEQIFGVTGYFGRDADQLRAEAERLRGQADALDRMAEILDELAALQ